MHKYQGLSVTLKTKDGLNTWTFKGKHDFKARVWERADGLAEIDSPFSEGVGQKLSEAVLAAIEKICDYIAENGETAARMHVLGQMHIVAMYFVQEVGS